MGNIGADDAGGVQVAEIVVERVEQRDRVEVDVDFARGENALVLNTREKAMEKRCRGQRYGIGECEDVASDVERQIGDAVSGESRLREKVQPATGVSSRVMEPVPPATLPARPVSVRL